MTTKQFKLLAVNDEATTCDVCGKVELQSVFWLENLQTGEVFHAGRSCGARLLGKTVKEFTQFQKSEVVEQTNAAFEALRATEAAKTFRSKIAELNQSNAKFSARMEALRPLESAVNEAKSEILKKFPMAEAWRLAA